MKCPNCGGDIPINQRYCAICGNKVEVSFDFISESVQGDASVRRGEQLEEGMKFVLALLVLLLVLAYLYNNYRTVHPAADVEPYVASPKAPATAGEFEVARLDALKGIPMPEVDLPDFGATGPQRFGYRTGSIKKALVEARGGDALTQKAVANGLKWLAQSQNITRTRDGRWSVGANGGRAAGSDAGVTGLALLAFMADGHIWSAGPDGKVPEHGEVVKKGIHWLVYSQQPNGLLAATSDKKHNYSHAMATMALTEALAMSGDERLRPSAKKAVEFIVTGQKANGGWNYTNDPANKRADSCVTGWQVLALVSARRAGIEVPEGTLKTALGWFASVTDNRTALTGYETNPGAARGATITRQFHSTTAIALLCRQSSGMGTDRRLDIRQANVLMQTLPKWDATWQPETCLKRVDLYYWYHATEALYMMGGVQWDRWNEALKQALLTNQDRRGYWPEQTLWGLDGGKVYTTSMSILCLTTYYRHP